jgi:polyisoprenoid-binding protein YceI
MTAQAGTYTLGPDSASLKVRTGKEGKAARAGHNLEIEVSDWSATVELGDTPEATQLLLTANSRSLRVLSGSGGMQALDDDGKANIGQTINDDVLKGGEIAFRSTGVRAGEAQHQLHVDGELNLLGATHAIAFDLTLGDDGTVEAQTVIRQSDFGMKPYSALFGTLKVKDDLAIGIEGKLTAA